MESSSSVPSAGKRLWHIVRVVFYMLRKSISKQKLSMDLQLHLERSKIAIAGKAFRNLMTFNHDHHHRKSSATDTMAYYYSYTNTPSFLHHPTERKNRHPHTHHDEAAAVAKAFEILDSDLFDAELTAASPWIIEEKGVEGKSRIDKEAEEFIRWFHEQLSLQQLAVTDTPDISYRGGPLVGQH